MIKCKQCELELDVTNAENYSEDGKQYYCPECKTVHTQEDFIQVDWATYSSPTVEQVNKVIQEQFKGSGMADVVEADDTCHGDSIYGVYLEMFKALSDRVAELENKLSESTNNKQTH